MQIDVVGREKMISEAEMLAELEQGINFYPLSIRMRSTDEDRRHVGIDAIFEVAASGDTEKFTFAAQLKSRGTPRAIDDAARQICDAVSETDYYPMIIVPYLRGSQLEELERQRISGIDLSGNGVIYVPQRLLVFRTGKSNKYPDSAPTKYAYRGTTSLVARAFLCRTEFESLADIKETVEERGVSIAISTVSKALKRLESDLIVDRKGNTIRLRQPEKLLTQLSTSYQEPKVTRTVTCSAEQPIEKLVGTLRDDNPIVLTGRSSTQAYAVMGRDELPVFYTKNIDKLLKAWDGQVTETSRFIDFELRQTTDSTVYFDLRVKQNMPYASPVQVFLELMSGDKREKETANQVNDHILREVNSR